MKLVVFGLSVSSAWGNGHATLGGRLVLCREWADVLSRAAAELAGADAALVTSYCPDALAAAELVRHAAVPVRAFYDLDTPVTLERIRAGRDVPYIGPDGLRGFDLVLSFGGGPALELLRDLGAARVAPLYGSVDPEVHRPGRPAGRFGADLSYLGTYAEDRQAALERLFVEPARRCPRSRFLIGGAQYPDQFPWVPNIHFVHHVPPADHPAFYASSRLTLNVTRGPMVRLGHCPPGRLFEAAASGAALVSDDWPGLEEFFVLGEEVLVARGTDDVVGFLGLGDAELRRVAGAARERTLRDHTAMGRAAELVTLLDAAAGVRT